MTIMSKKRIIIYLFVPSVILMGLACVPDAPPKVAILPETHVPEKMGLVIWVDGLDINVY